MYIKRNFIQALKIIDPAIICSATP